MKKIKILESLLALDKKSSNRYELATLYEACKLKEEDKKQLVKYIDSYEHPSLIGQFLQSKCDGICEAVCDDDDVSDLKTAVKFVDEINDEEIEPVLTFDDLEDEDECEIVLNESVVKEGSKEVASYVWNKVKDIDAITDDDSLYWRFDDSLRQGDAAKIITDESDLPDNAIYKFSLVEVDINLYYDWENECWYVLDKTYEIPVVEEAVEIHECPVCGRNLAEHEMSDETCPKCGEQLHKTDSGEYEKTDDDIDESKSIKEDITESISDDFCVYSSSPSGCYQEFCGSEDDCKKWITNNKAKYPSSTSLTIQSASETAKWNRDFDPITEDSSEAKKESKTINEDLEKDLKKRYTVSDAHTSNSLLRNIDELAASEAVKEINPVVKYDTQMFEMISADGRAFYLVPVTMSQFDVYDANEELVTKSEFARYIVDEVLSDKSNLEFVYEIVGGDCAGKYSREELEALPCFSGKYTEDQSDIKANGGFTSREELDNQPILNGYVGPMMDGWDNHKMRIRYETQEIYDRLSEALFEIEQDWTDYCPHCTNRSLTITDEHSDIAKCDSCGAEYQVVPVGNGKVRMLELNEGILDDIKKVGKTVGQIAKDRWNDSYTKAVATGIKKNFAKTKLGKDLKRVGDSIKDTDTYKKVASKVNDVKQTIKDNKHDDNRKPQDISMNVRGKDYRVSDLKFKMNGKKIAPEDVAKMSAFERRKVQVIVPRGTKPVNEGWFSDDDFEDDIAHANLYGGDTTYCRDCGTKKVYDEDGFAYCPECNDEIEL